MKNRPLCFMSLAVFLILCIQVFAGGGKFLKELKPSPMETWGEEKEIICFAGQIYQRETKEDYQILYLKDNSVRSKGHSFQIPGIIVYDDKKKEIAIGNRLVVEGQVFPQEEARNPGGFDRRLYDRRRGIYGSVWAARIQVTDRDTDYFREGLYQFRQMWRKGLIETMGEKDGTILSAILLGEKAGMDPQVKELYQDQGIGHILAISGLHISFIGLGVYQIFRRGTGSYIGGGAAGIIFLGLYVLMIGLTVSVVRAFLMFLFRIGADMTGRHYDGLTALSFSAAAAVLWKPLYLFDGGFWLSYGAVLGMLVLLPCFERLPAQGFWASLCVNLMIFPILAWYFFEFPPYSLILNLLVIPLFSLLLVLGLAGSLTLFFVPSLGELLLQICRGIFWIYEESCRLMAALPGSRVITGKPEIWQMAVYYLCLSLSLLCLWRRGKKEKKEESKGKDKTKGQRLAAAVVPILWCIGAGVILFPPGPQGQLSVTVLDVGQGDGIFIRDPKGGTYLIDGGSSTEEQIGKYRIEPFLKAKGESRIDWVLCTHGDLDHYSGAEELIERRDQGITIGALVLPPEELWEEHLKTLAGKAEEAGIPVMVIHPGQKLAGGGMTLTCLHPKEDFAGEPGNEASMVLALRYGDFDLLLTGDVEGTGEEVLTKRLKESYGEISWDVLKVAHHGSGSSTGEVFLEAAPPAYAVISAGADNRYGHPHPDTVDRLKKAGSKVCSTADSGAVEIETDGKTMTITGFLQLN